MNEQSEELRRLREMNAELLAALNACADCLQVEIWNSDEDEHPYVSLVKAARAAIAKAEGDKHESN